jgi:hypothetical protein
LGKRIKGIFFMDYVRMIRRRKDVDWSKHLHPGDLEILEHRVEPGEWYALEVFERMGAAIFHEIALGDMQAVYAWGRHYMDGLFEAYDSLVVKGDPMESVMRFQVLRSSFFDFPAVEFEDLMGNEVKLKIQFGMSRLGEEASANQTLGFFERLLELSGASDVSHAYVRKSWETESPTLIHLRWK